MTGRVEEASVASSLHNNLSATGSLLESLNAIARWRPFLLLGGTLIASLIVAAVLGYLTVLLAQHSGFLGGLMGLIAALAVFAIALVGTNAAGILLSDDVWGRTQRGVADALLLSALTSHRLVVIFLLEGLLFLGYLIALALVLFVCKIPALGPLLYAVAFPAGVILTGFVLFALLYVGIPLAAPAIWNGATVMQTLATLKEVIHRKLAFVIVMILMLGVLLLVVNVIIWGVLAGGAGTVMSLSALIIGSQASLMGSMMGLFNGYGTSGAGAYFLAMGFGSTVLFLIGALPGLLVGIKGVAIIHQAAIDGLSLEEAEAGLNRTFEEARRKASEAGEQARARMAAVQAAAARPAAQEVEQQAQPADEASAAACPSCRNAVGADDVFCGHCGHKLK